MAPAHRLRAGSYRYRPISGRVDACQYQPREVLRVPNPNRIRNPRGRFDTRAIGQDGIPIARAMRESGLAVIRRPSAARRRRCERLVSLRLGSPPDRTSPVFDLTTELNTSQWVQLSRNHGWLGSSEMHSTTQMRRRGRRYRLAASWRARRSRPASSAGGSRGSLREIPSQAPPRTACYRLRARGPAPASPESTARRCRSVPQDETRSRVQRRARTARRCRSRRRRRRSGTSHWPNTRFPRRASR